MSIALTLTERHAEETRRILLDAAIPLLERAGPRELTVRAVAAEAGVSERTVFRYFASREALLDAVAAEASRRIAAPSPPASLAALPGYARILYACFEEKAALVEAALHTEIYERIREGVARRRWRTIRALVDAAAPRLPARERKLAAAGIQFHLAATAWHYYRATFGFSAEEAGEAAERAIRLAVDDVLRRAKRK